MKILNEELPKPGDLFIGVIDLFAVLVPGLLAATLIVALIGVKLESNLFAVSGLIIAGWVLGHVLHGIGSWLDPLLYDPLFKPTEGDASQSFPGKLNSSPDKRPNYFHKNDKLYRLAKQLTDPPFMQHCELEGGGLPSGLMYQWARAWLNSHSPKSTSNLDRLEADSKLFRSLAVLLVFAVSALAANQDPLVFSLTWRVPDHPRSVLIGVGMLAILFSLWRYCDLRNKMVRQCYLNYVQSPFKSRTFDEQQPRPKDLSLPQRMDAGH